MQRNVPATPPFVARAQLARELFARRVMHPSFDRTLDGLRKLGALRKGPRARPLAFLAFLGPGLIAANAGNDAGAVATWSSVGAQYGYALLWVLVIITISLSVVQEMCARMGAATGKGLSDLIRERFGVRGAAFAMLTLLIANILITISEFAGIAAACELFGIPKYITVPLAAIGIWFVITRGSYDRVEKVFLAMSFAFFTYPIAAILAHPNWLDVAHGFVPSVQLKSTYLLLLIGTVGTTITPYMQLFIQSSVAEKGVTMEHYKAERNETYLGSIFAAFVVGSIVIATGATIFQASGGQGVVITSAEQAAQALVPFLGKYAEALFAIGLLGASLLAAAVLPLATAYAVSETFGFERGVNFSFREAPIFQGIFTGMLALGALVALIPGLPLIQLIIIAQVINGILLPILLIFILRLINDRRIMGQYTNTLAKNIIAWATVVTLIGLTALMLASVVLPLFGVPFLQ
ncbi:MAG TPA: Nramp family divalent metal transporter [Ktedonobacterales bacterium]|jgi:Mn2+/Fe2+ NRAMP family transporter|nr:Nramp family divalent metal transporter [Ktedonobacterales bacterium]